MSSHAPPLPVTATPAAASRSIDRAAEPVVARPWIRVLGFAALALYGVDRWSRLMRQPPGWRLLGLAGVAVALVALVPLLGRLTAGRDRPARLAGRGLRAVVALAALVAAFPISGLPWQWVVHVRIAVSVRAIGTGLGGLADVLVPYLGHETPVRLAIMLGAAVLLLDAAAVIAFAGRERSSLGDGRRAAAALPLLALAVVPSTLVPPQLPALQGLLLFALLALFMWGERIGRDGAAAAVTIACAAGLVGAVVAPRIDLHHPWIDYRGWAGTVTRSGVDSFDWNQSYGPLRWPQSGHRVLTVHARSGDYWKAESLSDFNGTAWVLGAPAGASDAPALPAPTLAAQARWSHFATVTVQGMHTSDVIGGSGYIEQVDGVPGGQHPGAEPGTWVAYRSLGPGVSYRVQTYSPSPSATQLARPGRYPWAKLSPYLTLAIPGTGARAGQTTELPFPGFHSGPSAMVQQAVDDSPYADAYALARRLAATSATPYAFAAAVKRYLDGGAFTYNQNPPPARYPLEQFLFHGRAGYCQQFSGAMAMLLRMGGVPARIGAGFTSGSVDDRTHAWTVSDIDAHAWVEVWFPRYGWVKFDPTPTSAPARGGQATSAITKRLPGSQARLPTPTSGTATVPVLRAHGHRGGAGAGSQAGGGGADAGPWPYAGGAALLAALLGAGWWRRRRRAEVGGESRVDPLAELERALIRTGRPLGDGVTLIALEHRFRSSPGAAGYIRALRLQRYGSDGGPPTAAQRRALRYELRVGLGLAGRLRALWALPPRWGHRTRTRRTPTPPAPGARA